MSLLSHRRNEGCHRPGDLERKASRAWHGVNRQSQIANYCEHFDLEVTAFSKFYFLVGKNGGELPKYEKNHAVSEHSTNASGCTEK